VHFKLKTQDALNNGRYDFIKDIERLERVVDEKRADSGYAVLLTNESAYWTGAADREAVDADFRIPDGRWLEGKLRWRSTSKSPKTSHGGREEPIKLRGKYAVKWKDYSPPITAKNGLFRFLAISIRRG
jgi:hypothetical protein